MQQGLSEQVAQIWIRAVPPLAELLPHIRILSAEEQSRVDRLQLPADRRRFLASRLLLRTLLSHYSDIPPQAIPIQHTATGKPYWAEPSQPIQFNLSHSHERILIGLMLKRRIGVDLEWIRPVPRWQRIAQRYFSAAEQAQLADCPAPERDPLFFQMWTQKEALLKGMGIGLAGYTTVLARDPNWLTLPLDLGGGYAAAVAVEKVGEETPAVLLHTEDESDSKQSKRRSERDPLH